MSGNGTIFSEVSFESVLDTPGLLQNISPSRR